MGLRNLLFKVNYFEFNPKKFNSRQSKPVD
jgi:hypothetical protein